MNQWRIEKMYRLNSTGKSWWAIQNINAGSSQKERRILQKSLLGWTSRRYFVIQKEFVRWTPALKKKSVFFSKSRTDSLFFSFFRIQNLIANFKGVPTFIIPCEVEKCVPQEISHFENIHYDTKSIIHFTREYMVLFSKIVSKCSGEWFVFKWFWENFMCM